MKISVHKLPLSFQDSILNGGYRKIGDTLYSVKDLTGAFVVLHETVKDWSGVEIYFHVIEGSVGGVAESLRNINQAKDFDSKLEELLLGIASLFDFGAKVNLYLKE